MGTINNLEWNNFDREKISIATAVSHWFWQVSTLAANVIRANLSNKIHMIYMTASQKLNKLPIYLLNLGVT